MNKKESTIEKERTNFKGLNEYEINRIMTPKNDYIFKRLFGRVGKEKIVKDFLEAVLQIDIKEVMLGKETIMLPNEINGKTGVLDVRATLNDNTEVDIEIQNGSLEYIVKRVHFYLSRLYEQSLKTGIDYSQLKKSIVICITSGEAVKNVGFHTKWLMTEQVYKKEIFDEMEIHFVELSKFLKTKFNTQNKLDQWLLFIDYSEKELIKEIMEKNENIKEAEADLKEIKKNEHEQYVAWLHEKYILEKNTALKAGIEQGIEQEKKKNVKAMLKEGFEISVISKITKLSEEEILNIKNEE